MGREDAAERRFAGDVQAVELLESKAGEDGRLPFGWSSDARAAAACRRLRRRLAAGSLPDELLERCRSIGALGRTATSRERDEARVRAVEEAAGKGGELERGWSKTPQALNAARALRRAAHDGRLDADLEARLERVGFDVRREGVRRPVECAETGEVYSSATEAARSLGRARSSAINNCLRGMTATAYGLHWRYADETEEKGTDDAGSAP